MKLDILAFGAHPDDVELGASGTLMKHVENGFKVGVVDLTQGELGTRGNANLRKKEADLAFKVMGLAYRTNLKLADGFFEENQDSLEKVIVEIRKTKPDIVLCNAIEDRHPDHARGSGLVSRACFLSGLRKVETKFKGKNQEHWRPKAVYHYIQDIYLKPNFIIDISGYWEGKMKAVLSYSSQFYNPNSNEPESPISGEDFLKNLEGRARAYGRLIGVDFGEGFTTERPAGVDLLNSLK